MGFCSQFKALLRKHFIVWRRNLCSSICEIIFPVIMMLLLTNLRLLLKEKTMEPISYVENCKYGYYFDANTKINLDPNVQNTADWMGLCKADPFTSCAGYNMPLFGIVVDDSSIYSQLEDSLVGANGGNSTY